jgi:hypothetical protein
MLVPMADVYSRRMMLQTGVAVGTRGAARWSRYLGLSRTPYRVSWHMDLAGLCPHVLRYACDPVGCYRQWATQGSSSVEVRHAVPLPAYKKGDSHFSLPSSLVSEITTLPACYSWLHTLYFANALAGPSNEAGRRRLAATVAVCQCLLDVCISFIRLLSLRGGGCYR